jgi:pimeloyl-ACP methyl ester carboxylesterase
MANGSAQKAAARRRWLIRVIVGLLAVTVLAVLILAGAGWFFSSLVLEPDHKAGPYDERVEAVTEGRVTLKRTEDAARPGLYGLDWSKGHAIAGKIVSQSGDRVTRTLKVTRGRLNPGTDAELNASVYEGNPTQALGIPFTRVGVPTSLGSMPAWLVSGRGDTWVIWVHGYDSNRANGVRYLPALRRSGLPTLLISYRNDVGAPKSKDGLIHLDATEWLDLQSAAKWAQAHGARHLVLWGDSMGGGIVCNFIRFSSLAPSVKSLILDAPALSWKPIFALQGDVRGVPGIVTDSAEFVIEKRIDFDYNKYDQLDHMGSFQTPIRLFHGTADETVPITTSDEFAQKLPRLVKYTRVRNAGHVESWNVDPAAYDKQVLAFLKQTAGGR